MFFLRLKYRNLSIFLGVTLVLLIFVLSGNGIAQTQEMKIVRMSTGPSGSANNVTCQGIASLVEQNFPHYRISAEISTGSQENIRMLQQGKSDFGIATVDALFNGYYGTREFDGSPEKLISFVMGGYITTMHFMTSANSGINSIADFKGRKIGVGTGVIGQYYFPAVLDGYGLSVSDMSTQSLHLSDICNGLADGTIDAGVWCTPIPSAPISDLATTHNIKFLEIEDQIANNIIEKAPYLFKYEVKEGSYGGIEEDMQTVATRNLLIARADLDSQIVYDFVKTIIENKENLGKIHPKAVEFNRENALEGNLINSIHPGAEKYYKEIGLIK